jgi:soluble lytic murein transglycosylase-like protein
LVAVEATAGHTPYVAFGVGRPIQDVAAALVVLMSIAITATADAGEAPAAPVSLHMGIEAYRSGEPARALAVFAQVAQAKPLSALPAIWSGIAATAAGRPQEAEAYFREGLRRPHSALQERITRGWLARLEILRQTPRAKPGTPHLIAALAHRSNPRLTPKQASWIGEHVLAAAHKEGVDPWLLAAVVYVESRFDHASTSGAGATGLGQLMPQTARTARVDPKDPWENLLGTARTLRGYYGAFRDWTLALAAYNAGEAAVRRYGGIPPYAETRWYVTAVWTVYHTIRPTG